MKYTQEHINFLRENYQRMNGKQLTDAFNKYFGLNRAHTAIRTILVRRGITANRKKIQPKSFTQEQIDFIREGYKHYTKPELLRLFNERFPDNLKKLNQLCAFISNQKIRSGRTGQFDKGVTPWNKGKRGYMGPNRTSFKDGHEPHNTKWAYYEREGKHGIIEISVPERNPYTGYCRRFRPKHVWIWEQEHGPVPEGHAVMFKDGDNRNFELDNLVLVSRTELLTANLHDYKNQPDDIKPAVLALAKLEAAAGFRTCPGRGRYADNR